VLHQPSTCQRAVNAALQAAIQARPQVGECTPFIRVDTPSRARQLLLPGASLELDVVTSVCLQHLQLQPLCPRACAAADLPTPNHENPSTCRTVLHAEVLANLAGQIAVFQAVGGSQPLMAGPGSRTQTCKIGPKFRKHLAWSGCVAHAFRLSTRITTRES
jgi:hypothetical protein